MLEKPACCLIYSNLSKIYIVIILLLLVHVCRRNKSLNAAGDHDMSTEHCNGSYHGNILFVSCEVFML